MSDPIQRLRQAVGVEHPKPFDIKTVEESIERDIADAVQGRNPLLQERQSTHGTFEDNANLSQALKAIFRAVPGWNQLTNIEKESMDMIAAKFSRILSGRSMQKQHWEDVVGYAKLVEEKCF